MNERRPTADEIEAALDTLAGMDLPDRDALWRRPELPEPKPNPR
jgi:hypothetical protein